MDPGRLDTPSLEVIGGGEDPSAPSSLAAEVRVRLGDLHDSWSQATWYLFNEEGWR